MAKYEGLPFTGRKACYDRCPMRPLEVEGCQERNTEVGHNLVDRGAIAILARPVLGRIPVAAASAADGPRRRADASVQNSIAIAVDVFRSSKRTVTCGLSERL